MVLRPDGRTTYKGRIYELYGDELWEVVCDFKTGLAKREMVATVGELPEQIADPPVPDWGNIH